MKTGLFQRILQLPTLIQLQSEQDETLIRLCMKAVISITFKGHQHQSPLDHFNSDINAKKTYTTLFESAGITDENEIMGMLTSFRELI
jgi:hypothetical protein